MYFSAAGPSICLKLSRSRIAECNVAGQYDQEKTGGCAECAYEQTFLPHPFPARMSELLEMIQKHEAEVRREFPDIYWKWRSVMDLLSEET